MSKYTTLFTASLGLLALFSSIIFYTFYPQFFLQSAPPNKLPLIAIANYGSHSSLQATIEGIKNELERQGYHENQQVNFKILDVNFDITLIPQMLEVLKVKNPNVMVAMTTPVAQSAKRTVKNTPLIFSVITDPVEAGLLKTMYEPEKNITGASDRQNLDLLLLFAKQLIPQAKTVGILYATYEPNDAALVKMIKEATHKQGLNVVAIPIDQSREIPFKMQLFKNKVDFIYVGASGPIQPALPAIAAVADQLSIPVFNVNYEEDETTIFSAMSQSNGLKIMMLIMIASACLVPLFYFLYTKTGLQLRAVGLNPSFAERKGISLQNYTVLGLFLGNALCGLAGGLMIQLQGYADISMGIGIVIHALASIMIGESLIGRSTFLPWKVPMASHMPLKKHRPWVRMILC